MNTVLTAFTNVFSKLSYCALAVLVFIFFAVVTLLWDQFPLLSEYSSNSVIAEMSLALSILIGSPMSMGWFAVLVILITSALVGIVVAMVLYAWRYKRIYSWRTTGATTTGTIAAILGIGCVACGPLLLGSILGLFGASGILFLLPFHGAEIAFLALGLLIYSLYAIAQVIAAPAVCDV